MAFFAYQGFEVVPVPAGESRQPQRDAPLAMTIAVLGTCALYVTIQMLAIATTPEILGSKQPLSVMAVHLLGPIGGKMVHSRDEGRAPC